MKIMILAMYSTYLAMGVFVNDAGGSKNGWESPGWGCALASRCIPRPSDLHTSELYLGCDLYPE